MVGGVSENIGINSNCYTKHYDNKWLFSNYIISRYLSLNHLTLLFTLVLILSITPFVNAEVWNTSKDISEPTDVFIPTHEYVGFFDSNDIYTVVVM